MNFFGLEITRRKDTLSQVPDNRGWISLIRESFPGAWQRNVEVNPQLITSHYAVFACMTLIAGDISKLLLQFQRQSKDGIWEIAKSPAYDPVLRNPNQMQNRIQFWENWILSKLMKGNTYVLKGRDARRVINRLWVLDPCRTTVLISESGDVFYQLSQDNVSGVRAETVIPASEIIHDRMNCLFHPLVGISPLYAAGLAAQQGLNIQNQSASFFGNRAIPGGILTAPGTIPDSTAARLKSEWESRYSGDASGKTAVLGDGLTFVPMAISAQSSQLVEQAKATAEWVCSAFHVPPYKIGAAPTPSYSNVQALNLEYYSQALQKLIEDAEECMIQGLEMKAGTQVKFDIDGLLRMDTVAQVQSIKDAVGAGILSPNEGRAKLGYGPTTGGEGPYLQQQNFSLEALSKRDAQDDPFGTAKPAAPPPGKEEDNADGGDNARSLSEVLLSKAKEHERRAA